MENIENVVKHEGCGCGCDCATQEPKAEKAEVERQAAPRRAYVPAVDLIDSENEVTLVVDVPGVAEGGVDLTIEKNVLTLSAVPADGVIAGKKLVYSEYGVGEYRRSFSLSDEINQANISATLKDGVLRISLPKTAPVVKKINVAVR